MALNPNVPVVAPLELITAAHINAIRSNLINLDTGKLSLTGGTMTGDLTMGGTTQVNNPTDPSTPSHLTRKGYVDAQVGGRVLRTGDTMSGGLVVGGNPIAGAAGSALTPAGRVWSHVGTSADLPATRVALTGSASGASSRFAEFRVGAALDVAGSIALVAGPGVAYNTTSDARLKDVLGPLADALERIRRLRPVRFVWKASPDAGELDGFLAHEVQPVAPYAVTGEPEALDADGDIDPQQLDPAKLLALVVGAVQTLADRLDALEGGAT